MPMAIDPKELRVLVIHMLYKLGPEQATIRVLLIFNRQK
jgi:hypothetical protein